MVTRSKTGSLKPKVHFNLFHNNQQKYALSILHQAHLQHCNSISNPSCTKLPAEFQQEEVLSDPVLYRRLTGSLQYLTITRPDIAFTVNTLSQHMQDPQSQHVFLLKRLLRYIKGTVDFGLPISKSNLQLTSFSDADWAGDPSTRKSTSGFCSFLGENLISWTVKKQHTVARSSTESEYRALAALTADVLWLRKLLDEFSIPQDTPTDIFCDNMSAIAFANNPVFHARTKHIEIDQKFVRDHILHNAIRILRNIVEGLEAARGIIAEKRCTTLQASLIVVISAFHAKPSLHLPIQ
ncbi:hypothetical protein KFK09_000059 [Dendrobium nobile]|uniref:Mitochondrial protein n=1 Tax=Dendrobium nobile TaxID=94219 RepID=A0A8T3CA70_DENNO|nr:hypothetical protein KFK09_000059 [Dendrobium nobile]